MGKQVLIDSNIAIGYIGGSFDPEVLDLIDKYIDEGYHMSIINQIEILGLPAYCPKMKKNSNYWLTIPTFITLTLKWLIKPLKYEKPTG